MTKCDNIGVIYRYDQACENQTYEHKVHALSYNFANIFSSVFRYCK